jgi:O-antigen/teichoic acid export membrane protein
MISTDRFFLRNFFNFDTVGVYSLALKIIGLLILFQSAFSIYWIPTIYEYFEQNPEDKIFYKKNFEKIEFLMFAAVIIFILFKDLILFFINSSYKDATFLIPFLVFVPIMQILSQVAGIGIDLKKKSYLNLINISAALICNIIGNYYLIKIFGAKGASISTGVSFIIYFYLKTVFSEKIFNVGYNLIKTSIFILLLVFFSALTTFNKMNFILFLSGIALLIVLCMMYLKQIKEIALSLLQFKKSVFSK